MWRMSERSGVDVENERVEESGCGELASGVYVDNIGRG